jgi:4-hydroxybenzoate polyprenyltransferase
MPRQTFQEVLPAAQSVAAAQPLIIDVDTAVARTQLLIESIIAYVKPEPTRLLQVLGWLAGGTANVERQLLQADNLELYDVPLHADLAAYAAAAVKEGLKVYLSTSAPWPLLERVAARVPYISGVIVGKKGDRGQALAERFPQGFDCAAGGNGDPDLWRHAQHALLLSSAQTTPLPPVAARFLAPSEPKALLKSMRLHQWAKNVIVFVPLVLGGQLGDLHALSHTLLAFLALGLVASATYILNDLWDLPDDRKHWSKRHRPLASRRLAASTALIAAPLLILPGLLIGALLSPNVLAMLLVYVGITLAYSFGLKRIPFVDGLVLATLFTVRLGLGAAAAEVPPSPWLFVFSMFLFASLSYAKRNTEIARVIERKDVIVSGRGYHTVDGPLVLAVGIASGIGAVMIMVLYIVEEAFRQSFYGSTQLLWGFPPLVFLFLMRIWTISARGGMNDDPVAFAIKDPPCLALLFLLIVCFGFAWLG